MIFCIVIFFTNLPEIVLEGILFTGKQVDIEFVEKWIAQPIQFVSAPIMQLLQLQDPYTRNIVLRNLFPLTKQEAKLRKKQMKRKGLKQSSSNNASLFASSLSLEIIYTVLNSVVTIIQQSNKAVDVKDNRGKKQ